MSKHITLGIETSCDETSAAVVKNGTDVLTNVILSQIKDHEPFGGVVPEVASRKHLENINFILEKALQETNMNFYDLDSIAVTYGPGLVGTLLVGISAAKSIAYALEIPLVGVNHLEGHVYSGFLEHEIDFPMLCLIVSGGHTSLVLFKDHGDIKMLGATRDDAAGEAFDKIARYLSLGYPGGPAVEKSAEKGNPEAVNFPRAWLEKDSLDFSFSGLKSAVINHVQSLEQKQQDYKTADIAASFQLAVVDVLVEKTLLAAEKNRVETIVLAGGVAANSLLRKLMLEKAEKKGKNLVMPSLEYCTDNAAMIACAGYYSFLRGEVSGLDLNAVPGLKI